jgi:hypothetical protein
MNVKRKIFLEYVGTYTLFEKQDLHRPAEYCIGNIRDLEVDEREY